MEVKYLYRVWGSDSDGDVLSLGVEVGIFDPERYEGQGGTRFGFTAEARYDRGFGFTPDSRAECSQASIGSTSPEEAQLRVDVYQQAIDLARFINDQLDVGTPAMGIASFLKENLATDPSKPADRPFKYGRG